MGINTATLSGNLGQDPEIKYFESGAVVASFSLAVQGWDGKAKEKKTLWFPCKAFNQTAQLIGEWVRKGNTVTVSGQLDIEVWESEGRKNSKTLLIVRDIQLPGRTEGKPTRPDEYYETGNLLTNADIPY